MNNRIAVILAVLVSLSVGSIALAESGERSKRDHYGLFGGGFGESGQLSDKMAERLGLDDTQRHFTSALAARGDAGLDDFGAYQNHTTNALSAALQRLDALVRRDGRGSNPTA